MKDVSIHILKQFRHLSFILVLVFVLSVVLPTASVMASTVDEDVVEPKEAHEVSMEDLEDEYQSYEDRGMKEDNLVKELTSFYEFTDSGKIYLNLPSDYSYNEFTKEEIDNHVGVLQSFNSLIDDGDMYVDENGDFYLDGDDSFIIQSATTSFSVRTKKIAFVKVPVGFTIKLEEYTSVIFGVLTFCLSILAGKMALSSQKVMANLKYNIKDFYALCRLVPINAIISCAMALSYGCYAVSAMGVSTGVLAILVIAAKCLFALVASVVLARVGMPAIEMGITSILSPSKTGVRFELGITLSGNKYYQY